MKTANNKYVQVSKSKSLSGIDYQKSLTQCPCWCWYRCLGIPVGLVVCPVPWR